MSLPDANGGTRPAGSHPNPAHPRRLARTSLAALGALLSSLALACTRSPASMAQHFNEAAAAPESKADQVVASLSLDAGSQVADLGAGGGYFTVKLAQAVGANGVVYAVDIQQAYLDLIEQDLARRGVENVKLVLATPDQSNLPRRSLDLVFVRNTFHDIAHQVPYFAGLRGALKPDGRVAIIDYLPGGILARLHGHYVAEDEVVRKMSLAGYVRVKRYDFLSGQSFNVFASDAEMTH